MNESRGMHHLITILFFLRAQHCSCSSVTMTGSADYAVLDQTFRFTCTVTDEDAPTLGSLTFLKASPACTVTVSSCSQNGVISDYTCGCVSGQTDVYYMNISSVSVQEDEETWRCERKSRTSNNITLPVYYGPYNNVTLDKSSLQKVIESSSLTVVCSSTCKPCSYTWRRGTVTVSNTKTLSLTNINRNQTGDYICTATNTRIGTTASSKLTVDVQYKPVISGQDSSYQVVESSPLHINCSSYTTPGNPSNTSYRWTGPDSYTSTGPVLSISSIRRNQTGQYTCTASNTLTSTGGPPQTGNTGQFMVDVQYLQICFFTVNSNINFVTVDESDHVTMRCQVDSNPGPTLKLLNGSSELSRANNILIEFNWTAACRQRGIYSCTANNNITDIGFINNTVHLIVKCSPRLDVTPTKEITAAVGDDTTLSVTLLSYPEPSITWSKTNNTSLRNLTSISTVSRESDISVTASLTLTGVQEQDFGEYFVQADNGVGTPAIFNFSLVTKGSHQQTTGESPISAGLVGGTVAGVVIIVIIVVVVVVVVVLRRRRNKGDDKERITKTTTVTGTGQVTNETDSTDMPVYAVVKKGKKPTAKANGQHSHHSNKAYQLENQRARNAGEKSGPYAKALNYLEVEIVQNESNPSKSSARLHEERTVYTTIQPGVRGPQPKDEDEY